MTGADMLSINTVAARLGLSVHQLRRWELMFGLEIKRGRGQQRQYRPEDLTVLERIKELVEQGWPTSQIRPQLEAEGLITPKLIGMPQQPGNPEMLMEAIIGLRSFSERRFIEISRQIDELRQLMISITLKQELKNEITSPWQPVEEDFMPAPPNLPPQEISIGPAVNVTMPTVSQMQGMMGDDDLDEEFEEDEEEIVFQDPIQPANAAQGFPVVPQAEPSPAAAIPPPVPQVSPARKASSPPLLGEVTDQNYLTILGKALDLIGWSDEQADQYSSSAFGVSHWDELGRSQAEKLISYLVSQMEGAGA